MVENTRVDAEMVSMVTDFIVSIQTTLETDVRNDLVECVIKMLPV